MVASTPPADGQIVATIIELLDRDPRYSIQFNAPAISLPQLAAALKTSLSSLSAARATDLIRPLADSLFDRPREPVVRKARKGFSQEEWIVFEGISKPGQSGPKDAQPPLGHQQTQRPAPPSRATAPSTPARSIPILPRPPVRRVRPTERVDPVSQEALSSSPPPRTLHLIPTRPGGDVPPVSARAQQKGLMHALGIKKKRDPEDVHDNGKDGQGRSSPSKDVAIDIGREYEKNIRSISGNDSAKKHVFDPMRDVPPPTPLVMGERPSGELLGLPKPRDRRGSEREADAVDEDADSTFDIISAYEDDQESAVIEVEGQDGDVGTVPLPKGKPAIEASHQEHPASENLDTVSLASGGSDVAEDKEDPFAFDGDEEQRSLSESVERFEERGGVSRESDMKVDTSGQKDQADTERGESEAGNDESEAESGESERKYRKKKNKHKYDPHSDIASGHSEATGEKAGSHSTERKRKHKHKHSSRDKKEKHKHHHRSSKYETESLTGPTKDAPPTPWLVTAFEGLPFGPDTQELAMTDWLRERWRLIAAQIVAALGAVYILQASGL